MGNYGKDSTSKIPKIRKGKKQKEKKRKGKEKGTPRNKTRDAATKVRPEVVSRRRGNNQTQSVFTAYYRGEVKGSICILDAWGMH